MHLHPHVPVPLKYFDYLPIFCHVEDRSLPIKTSTYINKITKKAFVMSI